MTLGPNTTSRVILDTCALYFAYTMWYNWEPRLNFGCGTDMEQRILNLNFEFWILNFGRGTDMEQRMLNFGRTVCCSLSFHKRATILRAFFSGNDVWRKEIVWVFERRRHRMGLRHPVHHFQMLRTVLETWLCYWWHGTHESCHEWRVKFWMYFGYGTDLEEREGIRVQREQIRSIHGTEKTN